MNYAQVIVSIPTRQIDRPLIAIPSHLEGRSSTGIKVVVPFGPKAWGYVVGLGSERL